jgi:Protein of unknown function (DUF2815)
MAKVVTKKPVRLTFCFLPDDEGVFRTSVLVPKKDKALITQIEEAIEEAKQYGKGAKWGGKIPRNLKIAFQDGDDTDLDKYPENEGHFLLNARSKKKVGLVDSDRQPILDADEIYSGCWAYVSVTSFAYDNESKGVSFFLNNIMKARDDESFGAKAASAEEDFAEVEVDEDDLI